jgi:hypothetical protein
MASLQYTKSSTIQTVTLGSAYTSGSGSMTLTAGNGAYLPSSGDFWLSYNDGAGTIRIFKVTARSTDTLTVTAVTGEGAGDGNISSGQTLRWALSVDALDQLKADIKASTGLVLLQTQTASSSASLSFTSSISSTYDNYLVEFINVLPATDGATLFLRMSTDGGSTYVSTSSYSYLAYRFDSGSAGAGGSTSATAIVFAETNGIGSSSAFGLVGSATMFNPGSSSLHKPVSGEVYFRSAAGTRIKHTMAGAFESNTAVNAFQFLMSSGNIASGTIRVYGLAKT